MGKKGDLGNFERGMVLMNINLKTFFYYLFEIEIFCNVVNV